jgi:hypothetical protein
MDALVAMLFTVLIFSGLVTYAIGQENMINWWRVWRKKIQKDKIKRWEKISGLHDEWAEGNFAITIGFSDWALKSGARLSDIKLYNYNPFGIHDYDQNGCPEPNSEYEGP